jgi:5'-3' exonuclease
MIDIKKPLLLIDHGYAMFYRYSATQLWYKHSHPEEKELLTKDYKWVDNGEFIEKMKKMFEVDILTLAKKYKIPKTNIIIAEDCHLKDNWRLDILSSYKGQRADERDKSGWNGGKAFEILVNEVIPGMLKEHNIIHLKHPKIEADDIIAQIILKSHSSSTTKEKENLNLPDKFIIVASDTDYFQLLDENVDLINMKGVSQKEKMKYPPKTHLIEKILKGDVSDNISACLFNKKIVQQLIPSMVPKKIVKKVNKKTDKDEDDIDPTLYIKVNKKIIDYYLENPDKLEEDIENTMKNEGIEYIQGYKENKKLIQMSELPQEYQEDVSMMIKKLF